MSDQKPGFAMPERIYYHRFLDRQGYTPWRLQEVHPRSVVGQAPWHDGYGHEYKWEPDDG